MELFELATKSTAQEFYRETLQWLECRIGFDGVIWGGGDRCESGAVTIEQFLLSGRPPQLITDYPAAAAVDPVSSRFLENPTVLQNISTHIAYRPPALRAMRDYLEHYRVRHLQITGALSPFTSAYSWIVCYREDDARPFSKALELAARNAVGMCLLAEQLHRAAHEQIIFDGAVLSQSNDSSPLVRLTTRQVQILHYIEQGWSNKLIAQQLSISANTLKSHIRLLFQALGVKTRFQAMIAGRTLKNELHSQIAPPSRDL